MTKVELWLATVSHLLMQDGLAFGYRRMLEGATAVRRGAAVEVRGGTLPLASAPLREALIARGAPILPRDVTAIVFPEAPSEGWLRPPAEPDEDERLGKRGDGVRRIQAAALPPLPDGSCPTCGGMERRDLAAGVYCARCGQLLAAERGGA